VPIFGWRNGETPKRSAEGEATVSARLTEAAALIASD
jgi:hypothetical protein